MTTEAERTAKSASYGEERVDALPFNTPEKSERYRTERFPGAIGLNWFDCDPTLQRSMRYYLTEDQYAWAEPHLHGYGALMGGPIAERAEITDKNPPRLVKYDRWGHDVSEVIISESARATKRDLVQNGFMGPQFQRAAEAAGVPYGPLGMASGYLLDQAEIGMSCAMGADAGMVESQVAQFAPRDVQDYVLSRIESGEWVGATGQFFTERTGGSDLGSLETTAVPNGDAWILNGFKWFASNCDGEAFVVLAKPVGAPDSVRGNTPFLVLKHRRDGSRNGIRIRQLKAKMGTHAVASGEVEFVDAEAFMLSGPPTAGDGSPSDGKGMARLMAMTNGARLGVAMMGLGCARRALVESLCYTQARNSWRTPLRQHPLMRRKLAEMIVDVEAVQAMLFEGYGYPNHQRPDRALERSRIVPPLAKLKAARLGITMASDAIEIHGGNGYIETWPVARILRDAQINTLWEGPDNILCLDVRRAIEREAADEPFLARIQQALDNAGEAVPAAHVVRDRKEDLAAALEAWKRLDAEVAEARLFPLAQFMAETFTAAILCERAEWELRQYGDDRKSVVAGLYTERYLTDRNRLRDIDAPSSLALERFNDLVAGALVDERAR
ncbi:MAG TPA: acyl-CoA dehydrogenase family protein [Dehalococcoidia bacterium]|nr:acyl-CoA dehydrogenase family protein [Dehalococcoidia bacterium]